MKYTSIILFATTLSGFATVISVGNGRGPAATREITDNTGALVAGFASFGIINEAGILGELTTFAGLDFRSFGNNEGVMSTSTAGQIALSFTQTVAEPFAGQNVYLLAGIGGENLASSTQLFIYRFDQNFVEQPTPINLVLTAADSPGTVLFGSGDGALNSSRFATASIVPIPEPSSLLFGAFALLGGLVRRRRHV